MNYSQSILKKLGSTFAKETLGDLFLCFCDRNHFNRTHNNLHAVVDEIRKALTQLMGYTNTSFRIINVFPIRYVSLVESVLTKPLGGGTVQAMDIVHPK